MLVNMKQLLEVAKENKFAVGAFNVADSNFLRVVVEEAEKKQCSSNYCSASNRIRFYER